MVVGIVGGVVAPLFQKRIVAIQDKIGQESSSVISQKSMGIPLGWFFGGNNGDFNGLNGKFGNGNGAGGGGELGPDSSLSSGKDGKGGDNGKDGKDGAGNTGPNAAVTNNANPNSNRGGGGGGGKGKKGGGAGDGDDAPDEAKTVDLRRGGGGGGGNGGFGGGTDGTTQKVIGPDGKEIEVKVEPNETPADALKRRLQAQSRVEEAQAGGCRSMNLFTILKIIAVIVLIVIGAAVALTGKGNKGSD